MARTPKPSKSTLRRLRKIVFERDEWTCQYCHVAILPVNDDERSGKYAPSGHGWLELDHIVPAAAGGLFTEENLRAACSECNRKKSASMRYADWPARILRAQAILSSYQPNKSTAARAIAALEGTD